jgi:hypothetical protein
VTDWTPIWLGVIAVAVAIMAAIQVGAIVYGARLAQRIDRLTSQVEGELKPVFSNLQAVSAEAARASALAAAQVERADQLFADVSRRVEETVTVVQEAVVTPAREGLAIVAGLRAAIGSLRESPDALLGRPATPGHDDPPPFIGG